MNTNKLTNIINYNAYMVFTVIISKKLGISGVGIFTAAFVLYFCLFVIVNGNSKNAIAKMVSIRLKRGFNDNAKKVFRFAILITLVLSTIVLLCFVLLNNFICNLFYKELLCGGVIAFLGVLFLINGLCETIKGYYQGCGGHILLIIGDISKDIVLIVSSSFIIDAFMNYGAKVSALKNDEILVGAYGAMGAAGCLVISFLVLFIVLIVGIKGLARNENYSFNEVRSKDGFGTFLRSYFPIIFRKMRENIFPIIIVFMAGCFFIRGNILKEVNKNDVYSEIAVFNILYYLIIAFAINVFKEYANDQYNKVRADYKKEDRKGVLSKYNAFIKSAVTIMMPAVISLLTFCRYICGDLLTLNSDVATKIAVILAFSLLLAFIDVSFVSGLNAVNLEIAVFLGNIVAFVVDIIFVLLVSKTSMKIQTTAVMILLFYLISSIIHGVFVVKNIGIKFNDFLSKLIKVTIAFLPMLLIDFILNKFVRMNILIAIICAIIGYVIYSIVLFAIRGVNQKDINNMQGSLLYYWFSILGSIFRVR